MTLFFLDFIKICSKIFKFFKQEGFRKNWYYLLSHLEQELNNEGFPNLREKFINFFCEKLVRRKVNNQFGGNLKAFVGGGALDKKIGEFLNLGLPTAGWTYWSLPVVSCNIPENKIETVGHPSKQIK